MTLRERLNEQPAVAVGMGAGLLVIAFFVISLMRGNEAGRVSSTAYYTVDDGQTFFEASREQLPPFQHDGKTAVRAVVYDASGRRFVNHLERYTNEGKAVAKAAASGGTVARPGAGTSAPMLEVKRPGESAWIPTSDMARAARVMDLRLPAGISGPATIVD